MSLYKPGIRVKVWDGSGEKYLGEGVYLGDVKTYTFRTKDGNILSQHDAEVRPTDEFIAQMKAQGAEFHEPFLGNPKIQLDTGDIVYGCQTWWEPVEKQAPRGPRMSDEELASAIACIAAALEAKPESEEE